MRHVVLYPSHYKTALACSAILYPLCVRTPCDVLTCVPLQEYIGLTEFRRDDGSGEGAISPPAALLSACPIPERDIRPRTFLVQA